jgi:hypothetical protein
VKKYWILFTAVAIMPLNGYLLGTGKLDIIWFILLCTMQLPMLLDILND